MVIVFVMDNYGELSNGTTMSANRFANALRAKGHTVRIVTAGTTGENIYTLKERYLPFVTPVARKQKMYFAKPDKEMLRKAFEGADHIHFYLPFKVSKVGLKIAKQMKIPVSGAFHVQPENITYGMGLKRLGKPVAWFIYKYVKLRFFKKLTHVHCPSNFIQIELKKQNYHNRFHVISNGVGDAFFYEQASKEKDQFQILMIGRYAPEKRQDILLKAVAISPYRDRIQVVLAGQGPSEHHLKQLAKKLNVNTVFEFYEQKKLIQIIRSSDLYVHAADVEIEAIACLEAIACGMVPVISNSKTSATKQFALDERSLFKAGKHQDLASKINYWIEHEEERLAMTDAYVAYSEKYRLDRSIILFEQMMKQAAYDLRYENTLNTKEAKKLKRMVAHKRAKRILSTGFYYGIGLPILWVYNRLLLGAKIKNRKYLRMIDGGAIIISNHVHTLDSVMSGLATFPKKLVFTGQKQNFKLPIAGKFVNVFGTVPVPDGILESRIFFMELAKQARKGRFVHFFPEGELVKYDTKLREFKRGAFQLAFDAHVPIVPIGISFQNKKGLIKKRRITVEVGTPIFPDCFLVKKEAIHKLKTEAEDAMQRLVTN